MSFIETTTKHQSHSSSTTWKHNQPRPKRGRRKPQRRFPPEVLSDREIATLIDACKDHTPAGLRNRALIAILYQWRGRPIRNPL